MRDMVRLPGTRLAENLQGQYENGYKAYFKACLRLARKHTKNITTIDDFNNRLVDHPQACVGGGR